MNKNLIIGIVLLVLAGMAHGVHETLHYHYGAFKTRFPNADDEYWNPAESWENKYKNPDGTGGEKFLGASTIFAWTTDAKHLLAEIRLWGLITGCWLIGYWYRSLIHRHKWYLILLTLAAMWAFHSIGFHAIYTYFF